ncbi:protein LITTLE ZIPPER 1-like isoform X2 [Juglans regia]|uniref:Protein LITTLE ZIPPER 1-like isoform X2 n=1 Tax=Juglans regia TaxID=51240 RepID=A0A6P9E725_JUGRE|nr:protein LITTLE ZIPPER 1-like isoform X2 [Juglans regia]
MCTNNAEKIPPGTVRSSERKQRSKRSKVQVQWLTCRKNCEEKVDKDVELKNLKLYLENKSIIEENEKLRRKANLLHQENLALMSEFQKKFPDLHGSSTLVLLHKH